MKSKSRQPRSNSQSGGYKHPTRSAQEEPSFGGDNMRMFEVGGLRVLGEKFQREVEGPIDTMTAVYMSKHPQRCLIHNNVITLYCTQDRRPLCVTCMYQNNEHKKHKVLPINRSSQELHQQTKNYLGIVAAQLQHLADSIAQNNANLQQADSEFPHALKRLQTFYQEVEELLANKKKEQLELIHQHWVRVRHQYSVTSDYLNRINVYCLQKITAIGNRPSEEHLLFNRNVASHLARLPNILPANLCTYQAPPFVQQITKFQQLKAHINEVLVFRYEKTKHRSPSRHRGPSHSLSPAISGVSSNKKNLESHGTAKNRRSVSPGLDRAKTYLC